MKRIFTLIAGLSLVAAVNAQPCIPNNSYTSPGFYPDTVTNLPPVPVGVAYSGVITAVIPTDTVYMTYAADIDSVGVTDIQGLPAGFTWAANTVSAFFHGGDSGCVAITGTATAGQVGTYPLVVKGMIHLTAMTMPFQVPQDVNGYKLVIGTVGFGENDYYSFGVTDLYPNPAADVANIVVTNNETSVVAVNITDMIGRNVSSTSHKVNAGENTIALNVASLPEGVYFYSVTKGAQSVARKLIINR
ncbi:MAG: hypothetical protein A2W93_16150 [Bacteroidetes bacterium GWF2_43_63]|nr:MAG: hypothetical protein A2W94_11145 [Bacteroidetes bacterium GWE2_42_42]OFY54256.1 MAG: hypothetical protein A2W93_16150 [Bacteroidetes bacterium GWF2_43_63]HBG69350.1 hypothetical protein [Bacteroidales bacterium]HCB60403.1 hypothetical protein [Bacteroidales bacterium]HCY23610.1 hypothetical protein [Bacteroidales bacterium]